MISANQVTIPISVQATPSAVAQPTRSQDLATTSAEEAEVAVVTIAATSIASQPVFVQSSPVLSETAMMSAATETPRPAVPSTLQEVREGLNLVLHLIRTTIRSEWSTIRTSSRLQRSNAIRTVRPKMQFHPIKKAIHVPGLPYPANVRTEVDESAYVQTCYPVDHQTPFRDVGTKEVNLSELADQGHKWVPKATHIQIMTKRTPRLMAFREAVKAELKSADPPYPNPVQSSNQQHYYTMNPVNEAFVENESLRELTIEKMGNNRILIIADAGMALQTDYSKGPYPDTIFLPFPRANLKQTLNHILALMKHGKKFKFWPQLILIVGAIDEVFGRREEMSVAGEENSLADVDIPLIVGYAKQIKEIQQKVENGEIPQTVLVAPPGLNNYYPRINRLMRTVTAMVRENGGHVILTGAELRRFVEPSLGFKESRSDLSAPAAWRFLAEISLCLPSIDEEHCIELTQADRQPSIRMNFITS